VRGACVYPGYRTQSTAPPPAPCSLSLVSSGAPCSLFTGCDLQAGGVVYVGRHPQLLLSVVSGVIGGINGESIASSRNQGPSKYNQVYAHLHL
jgi:hypothetical protein